MSIVREKDSGGSFTAPLILWLVVQLGGLLLPVLQVRLSANFFRPAERAGGYEMLIIQIGAAGLLMPVLFPRMAAAVMVIAASWPFVQLAGILSATPGMQTFWAGVYLSGWLAVLGMWAGVLRSRGALMLGSAVAGGVAIGGGVLGYLGAEFAEASTINSALWGPVMGVIEILDGGTRGRGVWVEISIALLITLLVVVVKTFTRRRGVADAR